MGVATVIKDYGTDILNAIRENDLQQLKAILEKQLKSDSKIAKLCVSDIKHRPTKKFACPLILASRQEDPRIVRYMMEKGVDPNFVHHTIFSSKRREIVTALHIAVDLGYYDTVEVLLAANGDPNIGDHNQETPLHISVKKADRIMTRMLLSKGADPGIPDRRGNAALHVATLYGHLQLVRTMLKYDADVYQKGQFGAIPPHIAAKEGHIHLIQLFCSRDVGNINIKIPCYNNQRETAPIHLAAENGHTETVRSLISQFDAEVNLKDSDGNTPLHCCVLNPYDPHRMRDKDDFNETARVLVKNRVSINEKNVFGDTALHLAAMNHFQRIVELLLEVGANPFAENEEGLKPIDVVPDSDPVTKNVLKMAMMNPRPINPNISYSTDTLQREQNNTYDSNMRHAMLADGVVLSSSQGTPENALDQSLSIRSVSEASFPSVFEDGQPKGNSNDTQGLGRVPTQSNVQMRNQQQKHPKKQQQEDGSNQHINNENEQSTGKENMQPKKTTTGHRRKKGHEMETTSNVHSVKENEITTYAAVDKSKKKGRHHRMPKGEHYDDDTVSFTTESSMQDDGSVFSMGMGTNNPIVQREIQKLFGQQQEPTKRKHRKKKHEDSEPSEASYMDDTSVISTEQTEEMFDDSVSASLDFSMDNSLESADIKHPKKKKKRKKHHRDNEMDNEEETNFDPYKDDKVIYENASVLSESVASDDVRRKKKKKSKNREQENIHTNQELAPYDSNKHAAQQPSQMQPGSVKVNTVPGKPGTIEVQYSGGPITISVDTSAVDQLSDGQYYFTDQHGNQFPVDVQSAQDLAFLQQLQQQTTLGKKPIAPPRPPKNEEPIYANEEDLKAERNRKLFKPPPVPPHTLQEYGYPDVSGLTNDSATITEMDDSADISDPESQDDVNQIITETVKEITKTPKNQNLSGRGTPPSRKVNTTEKPEHLRGTPTKQLEEEAHEKRNVEKRPQKALIITRAVSTNNDEEKYETESTDESPNVSPQYKSFADKLKWAEKTSANEDTVIKSAKRSRPPLRMQSQEEEKRVIYDINEELPTAEDSLNALDDVNPAAEYESTSSSASEGESVLQSPLTKTVKTTEIMQHIQHQEMYSLAPEINVDSDKSNDSESSEGKIVSAKKKPIPGPRRLDFKDRVKEEENIRLSSVDIKQEEICQSEVVRLHEIKPDIDIERYDHQPRSKKPQAKPRKSKSKENIADDIDEQPLPQGEESTEIGNNNVQEMPKLTFESVSESNQDEFGARRGRSLEHLDSPILEVSMQERSQSVESFYSDGGTRHINMRVTGEVPKAYNRRQKTGARRAFIKAVPQSVESSSDISDVEMGSRGSLDRSRGSLDRSRGSIERVVSPESIERAKRWSDEAKPIHSKSPEGLCPQKSAGSQNSLSPVPPADPAYKKGKTKLIGSYVKPYKSFGKIQTKTDALEDALVYSPVSSPLSVCSPTQLTIPEERVNDKSFDSPSMARKIPPSQFPSTTAKTLKTSPEIERANIVRPYAVTAQSVNNIVTCTSLADVKPIPNEIQEITRPTQKDSPKEATVEIGMATSAFKKNIKMMETGPETYEAEKALQETTDITSLSKEREITQTNKKTVKTVSLREQKVSLKGEIMETITTTVKASTTQHRQPPKIELVGGDSSSDTETSESESEDSSEDSSSDEGSQEFKIYETEPGRITAKKVGDAKGGTSMKEVKSVLDTTSKEDETTAVQKEGNISKSVKEPLPTRPVPRPRSITSELENEANTEKLEKEGTTLNDRSASDVISQMPPSQMMETNLDDSPNLKMVTPQNDMKNQPTNILETDLDDIISANNTRRAQPTETSFDDPYEELEPQEHICIQDKSNKHEEPLPPKMSYATRDITSDKQQTEHIAPIHSEQSAPSEPQQDTQPKKERIKGRRQIGQPKRGEHSQPLARSQTGEQSRPHNTSFGPEDEEVANINAAASARKEAIKAKKLRDHQRALQLKEQQAQELDTAEDEWEQALMAAQAQHGKIPSQLQKPSKASQPNEQTNTQILNPIPGVEITITGDAKHVIGPGETTNNSQVLPKSLQQENEDEKKKGFLKFPSKRKKKDKLKASREDLTNDEGNKSGVTGINMSQEDLNSSNVSSDDIIHHAIITTTAIDDTPQKSHAGMPEEAASPVSPEGQGIEQTVMGSRIERDDTIKTKPAIIKEGGFFKLPSKRVKPKDIEHQDTPNGDDNEAPEVVPKQSGLSQNELLASRVKGQTHVSGVQKRNAHPRPPLRIQPQIKVPPKETAIDDDLEIPIPYQADIFQPSGGHVPTETDIDVEIPIQAETFKPVAHATTRHEPMETNIDDDIMGPSAEELQEVALFAVKENLNQHGHYSKDKKKKRNKDVNQNSDVYSQQLPGNAAPQFQETNLDDPPPDEAPQTFIRNQSGRVSSGKRKGRKGQKTKYSASEEPKSPGLPLATSSALFDDPTYAEIDDNIASQLPPQIQNGHPRAPPADDMAALSQMWKSQQDQELDMMKALESTKMSSLDDDMYEQPVCHREHESPNARPRRGDSSKPQLPPLRNNGDNLARNVMMPQKGKPPLPSHKPPLPTKPPVKRTIPKSQSDDLQGRPRSFTTGDAQAAAQMWSQQQGKAEVVEMNPGDGAQRQQQPDIAGTDSFARGQDPRRSRRGKKGQRRGPPSSSSLQGIMSDSESSHDPRKKRRNISFEGDHHSEAEMNDFEPPTLPKDPSKSLQEAALETITAGLKNQPKLSPGRQPNPGVDTNINYTRGVYRPKPMTFRGSSRSSGGSIGGSSGNIGGGQYDDSSLVSQLWSERNKPATTESEGEADTEEHTFYDDSPERRSTSGSFRQPPSLPPQYGHGPVHQQYPPPHLMPSHNLPPTQTAVVRRRPKKKREKPIPDPGPVDFSQYGPTAKLWMEKVDQKTVQKSETMYLSVMPKDHKPDPDVMSSIPASDVSTMGDDDVFVQPQWVIARGRNIRRRKRQLEKQRALSGASSGGSDMEGERPVSPYRQMLLFFRVGSNWRDLAWVLFDGIQNDSETIRTLKDIELKNPSYLTGQVHDLMNRWWKKKGSEATIDELRKALDFVHMPYLIEECTDKRSSLAIFSESENELDISQVSDQDPDVSRLIHEYKVRSHNASFEGGALSDSGTDPRQRRSYNLSTDSLMRRLNEKGVTINRSKLGSTSSSLGRSSRGFGGDDSLDESVDYYSDGERSRSFIIVQPQLKSSDYRHETNI